MATSFDVAKYIVGQTGEISSMKLQKLLYYSQCWTLVWDEEPLFENDFQAWANGPVLPEIYAEHRGMFKVSPGFPARGDSEALTPGQKLNISNVLEFYGKQTAQWLSDLTHQERPWLEARGATPAGALSTAVIPKSAMHEYYSSL